MRASSSNQHICSSESTELVSLNKTDGQYRWHTGRRCLVRPSNLHDHDYKSWHRARPPLSHKEPNSEFLPAFLRTMMLRHSDGHGIQSPLVIRQCKGHQSLPRSSKPAPPVRMLPHFFTLLLSLQLVAGNDTPQIARQHNSAALPTVLSQLLAPSNAKFVLRDNGDGCANGWHRCTPNFPTACAPDGSYCCTAKTTCPNDTNCQTADCCPKNAQTCGGRNCCKPESVCCSDNGCCGSGSFCCNGGCCPNGTSCQGKYCVEQVGKAEAISEYDLV
ncbi:hypothetical protein OG21DRAFT_256418 [Imleria badia]|nr:hypothetical protein OG21DRAFT_256418 [Imleria badia]